MKDNAGVKKYRSPTMAGILYPEEAAKTQAALNRFNESVALPVASRTAVAVIAPHASWELSGFLAATAFAAAENRDIRHLVIIAPILQTEAEGVFLSESDYFETPLGDIPVDKALCSELASCATSFITNDIPHLAENSLELLLPFVKYYFPSASLVPILVGGKRPSTIQTLAAGLDIVIQPVLDHCLLVIASNLCSWLPEDSAATHADYFLSALHQGDSSSLLQALESGTVSASGTVSCAALLSSKLLAHKKPVLLAAKDSRADPNLAEPYVTRPVSPTAPRGNTIKLAALAYYS